MEGLIPYLLRAIKKQNPGNAYRCLSDSSTAGARSYHLLLAADSPEGSFHRRNTSDFHPQSAPPSNGLTHRVFTVSTHQY